MKLYPIITLTIDRTIENSLIRWVSCFYVPPNFSCKFFLALSAISFASIGEKISIMEHFYNLLAQTTVNSPASKTVKPTLSNRYALLDVLRSDLA